LPLLGVHLNANTVNIPTVKSYTDSGKYFHCCFILLYTVTCAPGHRHVLRSPASKTLIHQSWDGLIEALSSNFWSTIFLWTINGVISAHQMTVDQVAALTAPRLLTVILHHQGTNNSLYTNCICVSQIAPIVSICCGDHQRPVCRHNYNSWLLVSHKISGYLVQETKLIEVNMSALRSTYHQMMSEGHLHC
jgi:hypothetical protein